ncbi:MAG: ice-binding family protein, partial [Lentisphaerota bacterium]
MNSKSLQLVTVFLMFLASLMGASQSFAASSDKAITVFTILGNGTIDDVAKTVVVTVPAGTVLTNLTPTINVSPLATVNPLSGVPQDFTSPLVYTVTAEDLSTQVYTVRVTALAPVDLGSTGNFAILAYAAVTSTGSGLVNGDLGATPIAGSAIVLADTAVNGTIYTTDATGPAGSVTAPVLLTAAKSDMTIAFNDAAGRTPIPVGPFLNPGAAGDIGGLTMGPGLYKFTSTAGISTNVTLTGSANDVWIFQIATALDVSNGVQVILAGGARAENIFWQVGSAATIGTGAIFKGTILAGTAVTVGTTSVVEGRLFGATEGVTFNGTSVNLPAGASSNATITSHTYAISTIGGGSETITNVPFGTLKADFLAALIKGDSNQTWNSLLIQNPALAGDTLVVTAPDRATIVTYTVMDSLDAAKFAAHAALTAAYATYTVGDYTGPNWTTLTGFKTNGDTAITAATDIPMVTSARNTAIAGMAGVESILDTAKIAAHTALNTALVTYTAGNYTGPNWTTLTGFKTTGDIAIDAALNAPAVTSAQNTATAGMAGVDTILDTAKAVAHAALNTALGTYTAGNYSSANWITLNGIKATGDIAIDAAANTGAVTTAQNTATTGMAAVLTL